MVRQFPIIGVPALFNAQIPGPASELGGNIFGSWLSILSRLEDTGWICAPRSIFFSANSMSDGEFLVPHRNLAYRSVSVSSLRKKFVFVPV